MNNTEEPSLDKRIEAIGSKTCKVLEQTAIKLKPKANKLLTAFEKWLDSKIAN